MRVIIVGSRSITNYIMVKTAITLSEFAITKVISGGARGVDRCGEDWARLHSIPVQLMPADWNRYGKIAGPIRNIDMANVADALILVWDGKSKGSASMLKEAKKQGLQIYKIKVRRDI